MRPPRYVLALPGIYRSPLPLAREIRAFALDGGRCVVDLTQRKRGVVERACARLGLAYIKHPMVYEFDDAAVDAAAHIVLALPSPLLVHCFHGRDRTGAVIRRLEEIGC